VSRPGSAPLWGRSTGATETSLSPLSRGYSERQVPSSIARIRLHSSCSLCRNRVNRNDVRSSKPFSVFISCSSVWRSRISSFHVRLQRGSPCIGGLWFTENRVTTVAPGLDSCGACLGLPPPEGGVVDSVARLGNWWVIWTFELVTAERTERRQGKTWPVMTGRGASRVHQAALLTFITPA